MELRQIRYFIAVAETHSLTKAVERLHIAQPALSRNIQCLEEELGTRLFKRSRQGMALTDSGETFLEYAKGIIRQVNLARESVCDPEASPSGTVAVVMPVSVANVLSVPLFQLLKKHYPAIVLHLDEGLTGNIRSAFDLGLFDIILEFDVENSDYVGVEHLIREELYFIASSREAGEKAAEIQFRDLARYPIVLPQARHAMGRTVIKYAREQRLELNIMPSKTALHPAIKLIEAGIGCGILPWSVIHEKHYRRTVSARKIVNPVMRRMVSMMWPANRPRTVAITTVMELIRQAVKQVHAEGKWHGDLLLNQ